jgi:hypothetical protein
MLQLNVVSRAPLEVNSHLQHHRRIRPSQIENVRCKIKFAVRDSGEEPALRIQASVIDLGVLRRQPDSKPLFR